MNRFEVHKEGTPHKSGSFRVWDTEKACHVTVNYSDGFLQATAGIGRDSGRFRSQKQAEKFCARCNAGRVTWGGSPDYGR